MRLSSQVVTIDQITVHQRQAMLELMRRHYADVRSRQFHADLEQKHWAILLYESTEQRLCGFSTQVVLEFGAGTQRSCALFSGDTIVDRSCWGDPALGHAWGNLALRLIDERPDQCVDWFLISQGFRTYRYLALFFHEFYPRYDCATPEPIRARIAALAASLFGDRFDASRGVIRADQDSYRLRQNLADPLDRAAHDPHVAFFLRCNPGHVWGDELCCLAPLTRHNFTRAAWRVIDRKPPAEVA